MNISSVRLFLEVAEAGSLSKVAARRQTAQSHVSRQITDFEAECGGRLFRRTGRGVALTELGERAVTRLRGWLNETEQVMQELRTESAHVLGEVRLGIIPSAAHPLATRLFQDLQVQHPGIHLNILESQGAQLDAMLDAGAVDMAILFRFHRPSGREEKLLSVAHTYLVSAHGDPLTRASTVDFVRLAGLQMVLPGRPSHWRNALDETASGLGFTLQLVAEADSLKVQKELVANTPGLYTVLGPYSFAPEVQEGRLSASKLVKPDLVRHVTLALPKQGKLSPAGRVVEQAIRDLIAGWGNQLVDVDAG